MSYTAPGGWKVLGGGATVNWGGHGNLLYASYPESNSTWTARAKSHSKVDHATITMSVVIARLRNGSTIPDSDHIITSSTSSDPGLMPETSVALPGNGWSMTGGGAKVEWSGYGVLLTGSYPEGNGAAWRATSKAHSKPDHSGRVTAYLIAVKDSFLAGHGVRTQIKSCKSGEALIPSVQCSLDWGWFVIGGGALANWTGHGQLLTASNFVDQHTWFVSAKAHDKAANGTVTAFAIGVKPR
ncbi:hypothetical protein [Sorangium sp. So ce1182]|uniref:hypothetical protein n=1 Tax=Sorangium sp. So ce1182 TaxID=3133334 RepID=UPI003F5F1ED5